MPLFPLLHFLFDIAPDPAPIPESVNYLPYIAVGLGVVVVVAVVLIIITLRRRR